MVEAGSSASGRAAVTRAAAWAAAREVAGAIRTDRAPAAGSATSRRATIAVSRRGATAAPRRPDIGRHRGPDTLRRVSLSAPAAQATEPFKKLSIFLPMWNEQDYIERAVGAAVTECEVLVEAGQILDYEVIIVDDASTDATPRLADELAAADAHIVAVHHPKNRKLGGAMKTGFATATGDLVLYTDADLPFDMAEVGQAVRLLRYYDADIVSAYRLDRTGEGASRAIYTFFYNVLIRRLFGVRMRDINFAFKLCRRRDLRPHPAAQRGLVHRRRADHPGPQAGLRGHPVRCRLLPAHPRREHAGVARRDPHDPAGDVPAAARTAPHRAVVRSFRRLTAEGARKATGRLAGSSTSSEICEQREQGIQASPAGARRTGEPSPLAAGRRCRRPRRRGGGHRAGRTGRSLRRGVQRQCGDGAPPSAAGDPSATSTSSPDVVVQTDPAVPKTHLRPRSRTARRAPRSRPSSSG